MIDSRTGSEPDSGVQLSEKHIGETSEKEPLSCAVARTSSEALDEPCVSVRVVGVLAVARWVRQTANRNPNTADGRIITMKAHAAWKALILTSFRDARPLITCLGLLASLLILPGSQGDLQAQRLSRDLNVDLLINQAGYVPHAAKLCVTAGTAPRDFQVLCVETAEVVFAGELQPTPGDFGDYLQGDFSDVRREGYYYLRSDTLRSYPFRISAEVYDHPMHLIGHYFSRQRCGPSTTGYLTPCHSDDGIRMDTGRRQDVSGGWHDASDLRKWVGATIYGMIGLAKAWELREEEARPALLEELKWGNRYFLAMQEPEGYVMRFIGGDVKQHSDSNRWTDNEPGEEGGELRLVRPNAGVSRAEMLIFGTNDDRVIHTDPLDHFGQYNFVAAQALMGRIARDADADYAARCTEAAVRCFAWCRETDTRIAPGRLGASIAAALELWKTTGEDEYLSYAVERAAALRKLQSTDAEAEIQGFFFTAENSREPYKNIWQGCFEFIALCDLVEALPEHPDAPVWKEMIRAYARDYLRPLAERNSFGIVPFGLYAGEADPGGGRRVGDYHYRYFMQPRLNWWVGVNANLASTGVGLAKAARVLDDRELEALAQRQLDWILGVNPFNSSTLIGVGHNHPVHFPGSTFLPNTPVIHGAVMNGLGGDEDDQPVIGTGQWQISEYWTPMVAFTLWLMAELSQEDQSAKAIGSMDEMARSADRCAREAHRTSDRLVNGAHTRVMGTMVVR